MNIEDFMRVYQGMPVTESGCRLWNGPRTPQGYPRFHISGFGGGHRGALGVYLGRPVKSGLVTRHSCDNPACIAFEHLTEGTQKENIHDAVTRGRMASGDRNGTRTHPESVARGEKKSRKGCHNGRSILTEEDVVAIRGSSLDIDRLSELYGVTPRAIANVISRKSWSHIK